MACLHVRSIIDSTFKLRKLSMVASRQSAVPYLECPHYCSTTQPLNHKETIANHPIIVLKLTFIHTLHDYNTLHAILNKLMSLNEQENTIRRCFYLLLTT